MNRHVTPSERAHANQIDRDRAAVDRIGILAATRIGRAMRASSITAFERGGNPLAATDLLVTSAVPLLIEAMVLAHLKGQERTYVAAAPHIDRKVKLSAGAFDDAIDFLRRKLEVKPAQLEALRAMYEPAVLRVVGITRESISEDLQRALVETTQKALHVRAGVEALREAYDTAGVTPANSYTLEAVFRTQTQIAYAVGQDNAQQAPEIQAALWGYKYVTVGDNRVRPSHAAQEGTTLAKDDPYWDKWTPPCGWNCRCARIPIFDERRQVPPRTSIKVDGRDITPEPDPGFGVNFGKVYRTLTAA